ncbi:MAG: RteC domain-containing protein [Dysgonamonadaceae bacterium]
MRGQINNISENLQTLIQEKELGLSDIIEDVPPIISILEDNFLKLKEIISNYEFPSIREEIIFFKETKPQLFCKLIYFRKMYQLELNQPVS